MLLWLTLLLLGEGATGGGEPPVIGPEPDTSTSGFGRRRTAMFLRKNADFVNRRA